MHKLLQHHNIGSVSVFLDNVDFCDARDDLKSFYLFAPRAPAKVRSTEVERVQCCLYPSWRLENLFDFGRRILKWTNAVVEDNMYHSGGNLDFFMLTRTERLVWLDSFVRQDAYRFKYVRARQQCIQRDRMRDPQVYLSPSAWIDIIDSEYVIEHTNHRLLDEDVSIMYAWAQAEGPAYASLTTILFEYLVYLRTN